LNASIPFWQIANDGNLLPSPLQVTSVELGVAERADVIIDFSKFKPGQSIFIENRLEQRDGRGPTGNVLAAGQGNFVLRFDIVMPKTTDSSQDPATIANFYDLPPVDPNNVAVTRLFQFQRGNGQWQVNGQFADCNVNRFTVAQNTSEVWVVQNSSGSWMHPIHIHFEEHQILSRNGAAPPPVERSRKDVTQLHHNETNRLFFRFRDFTGRYPMHCHNVVHEDHAMMALWSIQPNGDTNPQP
jgi:FtsP/CotA-like multicopper oxidase with cupredoxin domain